MSILSKVALGLVFVAALPLFVLGARTLKMRQNWGTGVNQHKAALQKAEEDVRKAKEGDPNNGIPSIEKLRVGLSAAVTGRGRVWTASPPGRIDAAGNFQVAIGKPLPHQIQPEMVLHAFAEGNQRDRFCGDFKVVAAAADSVTLTPTAAPTQARRAGWQQASNGWLLYETLPSDSHSLFASEFAGKSDDERKRIVAQLIPPPAQLPGEENDDFQARVIQYQDLVNDFIRDNETAKPDDPPARVHVRLDIKKDQGDFKAGTAPLVDLPTAQRLVQAGVANEVARIYQRELHDYGYICREFYRRLPLMEDRIANLQKDVDYMDEAIKEADQQVVNNQKKQEAMENELAQVEKERDVVSQFRDTLQGRLDKVKGEIARLSEENKRLAAQIGQRQLQSARGSQRSAAATALAAPTR